MATKQAVQAVGADTVQELIDVLTALIPVNTDVMYVFINGEPILATLIENTLTDGSKTYDIKLSAR